MDNKSKEFMTKIGRIGGKKTLEIYGKNHFIKISKLGKITLKKKRKDAKKLSPVIA